MDVLEELNLVIDYIEKNIGGEISYNEISKIAGFPNQYLQRLFASIAGVSISQYIRQRKMSLALLDLQNSNIKILELATRYGYQSPTAFNRTFQEIHGVPPSNIRFYDCKLSMYPRLKFNLSITGNAKIAIRIEHKISFSFYGVKQNIKNDMDENFKKIPIFWQNIKDSELYLKMIDPMNNKGNSIIGLTNSKLQYYIGIISNECTIVGLEQVRIDKSQWVVFKCTGSPKETCQNAYRQFYTEWLPQSNYEHNDGLELEIYPVGDSTSSNYTFELWFEVKMKGDANNEISS